MNCQSGWNDSGVEKKKILLSPHELGQTGASLSSKKKKIREKVIEQSQPPLDKSEKVYIFACLSCYPSVGVSYEAVGKQ